MQNKSRGNVIRIVVLLVLLAAIFFAVMFMNSDTKRSQEFLQEASGYMQEERYESAATLYDYVLEIEPDNVEAKYGLVQIGLLQNDFETMKELLDDLALTEQDTETYQAHLYRYAMAREDYPLAQSLVINNIDFLENEEDYLLLASGLEDSEYFEQALEISNLGLEKYPENNDLKTIRLTANLGLGNNDAAIRVFIDGVEDLELAVINQVAAIFESNDDIDNLIEIIEASLEIDPNQADMREKLYVLYGENHRLYEMWELREEILLRGEELPQLDVNVVGNTFANTRYHSLATKQANSMYMLSPYYYRIHVGNINDLANAEQVINRRAAGLNVQGEYVYFIDTDNNDSLSKAKTDGSEYEVLWGDSMVKDPFVIGDYIYFINYNTRTLNRIMIDGSEHQVLDTLPVHQFVFDNEYFYYIEDNSRSLYKQKHDDFLPSGDAEIIFEGNYKDLNIDEFSTLYFLDMDQGGHIIKTTEGSNVKNVLSAEEADFLNYHNGILYYVNWTVYRIGVDGENRQVLSSHFSSDLAITDEWVFSLLNQFTSDLDIYYFKHNGSELNKVPKWLP